MVVTSAGAEYDAFAAEHQKCGGITPGHDLAEDRHILIERRRLAARDAGLCGYVGLISGGVCQEARAPGKEWCAVHAAAVDVDEGRSGGPMSPGKPCRRPAKTGYSAFCLPRSTAAGRGAWPSAFAMAALAS